MSPDVAATQRDIERVLLAVARVEDKLDRGYADHETRLRYIETGRARESGAEETERRSAERISGERRWRWSLVAGVVGSVALGLVNLLVRIL